MSTEFTQLFDGNFEVKPIQPERKDLLLDLSMHVTGRFLFRSISSCTMGINQDFDDEVYWRIMNHILGMAKYHGPELPDQARFDNLAQLSFPQASVHSECNLLAFHHRNPLLSVVNYIGLSKRPCRACSLYFRAYNGTIGKQPGRTMYSTRCSHDRIRMHWASLTLECNRTECSNSNAEVKRWLVDQYLQPTLWNYVGDIMVNINKQR